MNYLEAFEISAPRLVNITSASFKYFNLKGLKPVMSAPKLKFFDFYGLCLPILSTDECPALDKIKIHMVASKFPQGTENWKEHDFEMLRMAERLAHGESTKLSWSFSQVRKFFHFVVLRA